MTITITTHDERDAIEQELLERKIEITNLSTEIMRREARISELEKEVSELEKKQEWWDKLTEIQAYFAATPQLKP